MQRGYYRTRVQVKKMNGALHMHEPLRALQPRSSLSQNLTHFNSLEAQTIPVDGAEKLLPGPIAHYTYFSRDNCKVHGTEERAPPRRTGSNQFQPRQTKFSVQVTWHDLRSTISCPPLYLWFTGGSLRTPVNPRWLSPSRERGSVQESQGPQNHAGRRFFRCSPYSRFSATANSEAEASAILYHGRRKISSVLDNGDVIHVSQRQEYLINANPKTTMSMTTLSLSGPLVLLFQV